MLVIKKNSRNPPPLIIQPAFLLLPLPPLPLVTIITTTSNMHCVTVTVKIDQLRAYQVNRLPGLQPSIIGIVLTMVSLTHSLMTLLQLLIQRRAPLSFVVNAIQNKKAQISRRYA